MNQQGVPEITIRHPGIDVLGPGCRVSPTCTVWRRGDTVDMTLIRLGRDCVLLDNVRIVVTEPRECPQAGVVLGDQVIVNVGCYLSGEGGLVIEDEVLLGPYVQVLSAGHGLGPQEVNIIRNPATMAPVVIERGAWIGAGAIILPGRRIGAGAVVGAGSVVTRDVPPLAVVAGNPARVMRRRVDNAVEPDMTAGTDLAMEYSVLIRLYDNLQAAHTDLRLQRDLIQNNYTILECGYKKIEGDYDLLKSQYSSLECAYRNLEELEKCARNECLMFNRKYGKLEKFGKKMKSLNCMVLFSSSIENIICRPAVFFKQCFKNNFFDSKTEQGFKIRSISESVRRYLRPRSRWNTLRGRYHQSGFRGVARLIYEFSKRTWRERQSLSLETVAPAVSLEIAKVRLREQAEANFLVFAASSNTIRFSPGNAPWLSIVLVLWGQAELTLACLQALAGEAREGVEIIIVDNASPDATATLLERVQGATILRNQDNKGFLLAANQGAMAATAPFLLFLNNDAVPRPGSLGQARAILDADAGIGAVGGRILLPDGRLQEAGCAVWRNGSCAGYLRGEDAETPEALFRRDVDFCSGVFLLTRTEVFRNLGGFDDAFAPAYYEEVDYCLRLWEHGLRVVYDPWIVVDHYEYGSAGSSEAASKRMAINQELFWSKHAVALAEREAPNIGGMLRARMRGAFAGRVLYVDDRIPRADLGSGYPRALALLKSMAGHGLFVTVVSLAEPTTTPSRHLQDGLPPEFEILPGLTPDMLADLLEERQGYYDIFFISRPSNMDRLYSLFEEQDGLLRGMTVLYDAEAVWAFRDISRAAVLGQPMAEGQVAKLLQKELDLAKPAACILAVSEMEREVFRRSGYTDVRVLSHAVPTCPAQTPFAERSDILFVGALFTPGSPNIDSMIWFMEKVMPLLDLAGLSAKLIVAGRNDALPRSFASRPDVVLLGRVDDLTAWYAKCRIFIAPTRFSAGIPLKVVEATGHGLPVVATSLLARQLGWNDGEELVVGDDPETFARQCQRLYQEPDLWANIQAAALRRIGREYSQDCFHNVMAGLLADYPVERGRREGD